MRDYKTLLVTVSEMEISSPVPNVKYVQMEVGDGQTLSVDSPRPYPKLLGEVKAFNAGLPPLKQKKTMSIIPSPPIPKPQAAPAPAPAPPPQAKAPKPEKPKVSGFHLFGMKQAKPQANPVSTNVETPTKTPAPQPPKTMLQSEPESQKPDEQGRQPKKGWFSSPRGPKGKKDNDETAAQQPVQEKQAAPPTKPAAQPPLEDSVAKELSDLTKSMKSPVIAPAATVQQIRTEPAKDLVLPKLSLADQVEELDKIVSNLAQRRFDSVQMAIVKDEVGGLSDAISSQPQPSSASPFARDLITLRKTRLAEALALIKGS